MPGAAARRATTSWEGWPEPKFGRREAESAVSVIGAVSAKARRDWPAHPLPCERLRPKRLASFTALTYDCNNRSLAPWRSGIFLRMRLVLDARARALLRRLPRTNVYSALELLLLAGLAVQCARLFWVLATPVGPLGAWQPVQPGFNGSPAAMLQGFDPFFR